jgi:hypothetical protein
MEVHDKPSLRNATQQKGTTEVTRGRGKLTMPRLGCGRVKEATTRLPRGSYRLIGPRICCGRVKVVEGQLQVDNAEDRLW